MRAATFDTPSSLQQEIDRMKQRYETAAEEQQMETIPENFSEEYSSINDEDSSDDDLPAQDKKALLECIRSSQGFSDDQE